MSGGSGIAARSVAVLSMLLSFAVRRGLKAGNPALGVRLLSTKRRERFLSFAEIGGVGEALSKLEAGGENPMAIAAIRLLLLTGCRRSEIPGMHWTWVDFERRSLRGREPLHRRQDPRTPPGRDDRGLRAPGPGPGAGCGRSRRT